MLATIASLSLSVTPVPLSPAPLSAAPPQSEPRTSSAVQVTNGLGLALYRRLVADSPGGNVCCSPLSIAMALSMLAEGAEGETLAELRRALAIPAGTELCDVHAAFAVLAERYRAGGAEPRPELAARIDTLWQRLRAANAAAERLQGQQKWEGAAAEHRSAKALARELNELLPQVSRYEMNVANALWVERSFPLVPDFAATLARSYGTGAAAPLDFRGDPEAARRRINGWVAEQTRDRIPDLIPPGGVSPATALVVANAVCFRGEWAEPFHEAMTKEGDFQLADGSRVKAHLMHDAWRTSVRYAAFGGDGKPFATPKQVPARPEAPRPATYPDDRGFTMVELPYKGGELAMVVIAPRSADGLAAVEELLTPERLAAWCAALEQRTVDTAVPRFEVGYGAELGQALRAIGVQRAFVSPGQPGAAQFGGISRSQDPQQQVAVSSVVHRAWIAVNEKGTEAAAATAIMLEAGAAFREEPMVPFVPVFRADRPFAFLIRDVQSGAVLFAGRVLDPRVGR